MNGEGQSIVQLTFGASKAEVRSTFSDMVSVLFVRFRL